MFIYTFRDVGAIALLLIGVTFAFLVTAYITIAEYIKARKDKKSKLKGSL